MHLKTFPSIFILLFLSTSNLVVSQTIDPVAVEKLKKTIDEYIKERENKVYELIDKPIPEFNLTLLEGGNITSESLKGKPTLIYFWITHCPNCVIDTPILNKIKTEFGKQVNFISITLQDKMKVNRYLSKHDFDFTHVIGARNYNDKTGLDLYPQVWILDKNLMVKSIVKTVTANVEFKSNIVNTLMELKNVR